MESANNHHHHHSHHQHRHQHHQPHCPLHVPHPKPQSDSQTHHHHENHSHQVHPHHQHHDQHLETSTSLITVAQLRKMRPLLTASTNFIQSLMAIHFFSVHRHEDEIQVLMITSKDEVFALGTNVKGILGTGDREPINGSPRRVKNLSGQGVIQFSNGMYHVMALTKSGRVWVWGDNSLGQLGDGTTNTSLSPIKVRFPNRSDKKMIQIASGDEHCLTLSAKGQVYCWGYNYYGQCGRGDTVNQWRPRRILLPAPAKLIQCGIYSSFALLENGTIMAWGNNGDGQIGIGSIDDRILSPVRVIFPAEVQIANLFTRKNHCIATTTKDEVYVWGSNNWGQLGLGDTEYRMAPVKLTHPEVNKEGERIIEFETGFLTDTSVARTSSRRLLVWGQVNGQEVTEPQCATQDDNLVDLFHYMVNAPLCRTLTVAPEPCKHVRFNNLSPKTSSSEMIISNLPWNDPRTSDLSIYVGGRTIYVHKSVLERECEPFLKRLTQVPYGDGLVAVMNDFPYPVYKLFTYYLYTHELVRDLPGNLVNKLGLMAEDYNHSRLNSECERRLIEMGILAPHQTVPKAFSAGEGNHYQGLYPRLNISGILTTAEE